MDPLSVVGSIIAIVTAVGQVSNAIAKITASVRDADEVIAAIQSEVRCLERLVITAATVIQQHERIRIQTRRTRDDTRFSNILLQVQTSLGTAQSALDTAYSDTQSRLSLARETGKAIKEFLSKKESKLEKARRVLEQTRRETANEVDTLQLILNIEILNRIDQIENIFQGSQATQDGFSQLLQTFSQKLDSLPGILQLQNQTPSIVVALPVQQQANSINTQATKTPLSINSPGHHNALLLRPRRAGPCNDRCVCVCHRHNKISQSSPTFFQRWFGQITFKYSGPYATPRCDIPKCKGNGSGELRVQYSTPAWSHMSFPAFFGWVFQGPEFSVRTWNMRPETDEVFELVQEGNIPELRRLLREGKASIRDITAENGHTLLHWVAAIVDDSELCDMVEFLLLEGADSKFENYASMTPYETLLYFGSIAKFRRSESTQHCLDSLFSNTDFDPDDLQLTSIHSLVHGEEDGDLAQELKRYEGTGIIDKADKWGYTPLVSASLLEDFEKVCILLDNGADPTIGDEGGCRFLLNSLLFEDTEGVCANIDIGGIILKFKERNIDVDPELFIRAMHNNNPKAVRALLDGGVEYDGVDSSSCMRTPAMIGVAENSHDALRVLFDKNRVFDYTKKDVTGANILHLMGGCADLETLKIMRVVDITGIDPDEKDSYGRTASDLFEMRIRGEGAYTLRRSIFSEDEPGMRELFNLILGKVKGSSRISSLEGTSDDGHGSDRSST